MLYPGLVSSILPSNATLEYLGRQTAVSSAATTYSFFTADFAGLTSGGRGHYIAVVQSRDASGSTEPPFVGVSMTDGFLSSPTSLSTTVLNRTYPATVDDYNSHCIAYSNLVDFSSSFSISVALLADHEGQANVYLYRVSTSTAPTVASAGTYTPTPSGATAVSTSVTPPSGSTKFMIAVVGTSNSTSAWTISNGPINYLTQNSSADTGTTEWTTVSSGDVSAAGSPVPAVASGAAASNGAGILAAVFSY